MKEYIYRKEGRQMKERGRKVTEDEEGRRKEVERMEGR